MLNEVSIIAQRLPPGLKRALKVVLAEASLARRHRRGEKRAKRVSASEININVGCGPKPKAGWINIDLWSRHAEALTLDLRCDLPFPDGCASIIYGEHFFEHLEYPVDARHFLAEARRVLKPGGVLHLGVPDAERGLRAYIEGDDAVFAYARQMQWHPNWCDTHMHQINYLFRQRDEHTYAYDYETLAAVLMNEHRYAYDYETLAAVLTAAGFDPVVRRDWSPTLDSEDRKGSLYVVATNVSNEPS